MIYWNEGDNLFGRGIIYLVALMVPYRTVPYRSFEFLFFLFFIFIMTDGLNRCYGTVKSIILRNKICKGNYWKTNNLS